MWKMEMLFRVIELETLLIEYRNVGSTLVYWVFLFLVLLDLVTGIAKGFINKEANSTKGLLGVIKHLLVVLLVLCVTPFLKYLQLEPVAQSFILFFIAQYGISVVENWGQLGLPLPDMISKYFDKLNRETNEIDLTKAKIVVDEKKEDK